MRMGKQQTHGIFAIEAKEGIQGRGSNWEAERLLLYDECVPDSQEKVLNPWDTLNDRSASFIRKALYKVFGVSKE